MCFMRFSATYNFLVLLFLYAFCCTCVLGIELLYDANLHMAVVYSTIWNAAVATCLLAPILITFLYIVLKKGDDVPVSNGMNIVTTIFNMVWLVSLTVVVMCNLASINNFLAGGIDAVPFLLGVMVNVFALIAYFSNYCSPDKCIHSHAYKTFVSLIITSLALASISLAQMSLPVQYIRAVHRDGKRHDMLRDLEGVIKTSPNWTPDKSSWSSSGYRYDKIAEAINSGEISVKLIDETHVKMEWKRDIEVKQLDESGAKNALLQSYKSAWYDWGCYYEQTEKVVEMQAKVEKIKRDKQSAKKIDTSEKTEED